jgi:hypothetical protein
MSGRARVYYQVSWTTLPGLRGLSCSEFRATPTATPDSERGVAVSFASDAAREALLAEAEKNFAARRFTSASDAFDTVKAYIIERAAQLENDPLNKGDNGRTDG